MKTGHWTDRSVEDFRFSVAHDFASQLESRIDTLGWSQTQLAKVLGVSKGRVSQIMNDPGNLTLDLMIEWSRAVGMKLCVFAYDDGDSGNTRGPINSAVFLTCWRNAGMPTDMWAFEEAGDTALVSGSISTIGIITISGVAGSLDANDVKFLRSGLLSEGRPLVYGATTSTKGKVYAGT